ncbi:MAG: alpha/beta hydrolase [Actinomycetia bacterium]|nr:alpha/beta hydrolase [Actinomycetes bacterium]
MADASALAAPGDPLRLGIDTPSGLAWADLDASRSPGAPTGLLVIGHGAGGGVDAPDLLALRAAAWREGFAVARVTQPYRVAGRRAPAPAARLDQAWLAVIAALRRRPELGPKRFGAEPDAAPHDSLAHRSRVNLPGVNLPGGSTPCPLVLAGRSSGARVACRTAVAAGARAVIALAFPLHPPGRPERHRLGELDECGAPVLVVQGARDAFGMPPPSPSRRVVVIDGADHSLKKDPAAVALAAREFLCHLRN